MLRSILILAILCATGNALSSTVSSLPPDTTTNIVDKSAAIYMVDEGKTLYLQGKVKNALNKFREASVKDPHNWKAHYWIGKCHYLLNNYGYALQYANLATTVGSEKYDDEVHFLIAESYHRLGKLDSALIHR